MAQLLGFDRIHEHSYDAVSAKDFLLEYLFILASVSSDIGRIAESLLLWNTEPFAMIALADEYTSFSSIMPQKKNPVSIETLRAFNVLVYGKLLNAFGILKAEPWSNGRETVILDDDSVDTGRQVRDMVLLLKGILNTLEVRKNRMEELSDQGFSTATELADTLVRRYGFSFRTAHEVVGLVVKKAAQARLMPKAITAKMVEESIQEHLGRFVSIDPEEVRKALDPRENVERRRLPGGPAFEQGLRMLTNRKEGLEERRTFLSHRRHLLAEAHRMLDEKVKEFIGEETV
jgi:argininosuccinate lyase